MKDYLRLRVIRKKIETPGVVSLTLTPETGSLSYQAGQFLTFIFEDLGSKEVRRSYSMSSSPSVDEELTITVKQQVNGLVSRYLVRSVQPGDILTALPPAGQFTLAAQKIYRRDLFFFAGGVGITPLFSLIKQFLKEEPQSRIHLLYANRNEKSILFREALRRLAETHPSQWHILHLLSSPTGEMNLHEKNRLPIQMRRGRLSNALVEEWVRRHRTYDRSKAAFFLCGPKGFMIKTRLCLGYMGFGDDQIHREIFDVTEPYRPPVDRYKDAKMKLLLNGQIYYAPVKAGQTLLEAAEATGLRLPFSCRSGICTTCTAKCLEGKAEMHTPEGSIDTDSSHGTVLICVGYSLSKYITIGVGEDIGR